MAARLSRYGYRSAGIALAVLAVAASAADASPAVLRGQTSQNQPLALTLDRGAHGLRVHTDYLLRCGVAIGRHHPDFNTPLLRKFGRGQVLRTGRSGLVAGAFRSREHLHPNREFGLVDRRAAKVVRFSGRVRSPRPAGAFRVTVRAHEIRHDQETGERFRELIRCDTGRVRWRVPNVRFSGPWRPTPPMVVPRSGAALTALGDGSVLVAGGYREIRTRRFPRATLVRAAEIYDAADNRWTRAGSLGQPRSLPGAVRLADGRVLVAGGGAEPGFGRPRASAEIYDPQTNRWTPAAPMRVARIDPTLTLLPSGEVLAVSGFTLGPPGAAELYDPASNSWTPAADLPPAETNVSGTDSAGWAFGSLLHDGRVLLVGGFDGDSFGSWSVYDPGSDSWTPRRRIPRFWRVHQGTTLPDGRVFVAGVSIATRTIAAVYGPSGWTPVAKPPRGTYLEENGAATLPSGRVLLANRTIGPTAIYDPMSDRWAAGPTHLFEYPSNFSPNPLPMVATPDGALIADQALNRFSSAERFFER